MLSWIEISGQKINLKTSSYRNQIEGCIIEKLKKERSITDEAEILKCFTFIFSNKKKQHENGKFDYFNLTTLTRYKKCNHFDKYLDEPEYTGEKEDIPF